MTIYPPTVDYSIPAFLVGQPLNFYFTIPKLQNLDSNTKIQYKLLFQDNNKTALSTVISDPVVYNDSQGKNYITILPTDLANGDWIAGKIYKIQIRFYFVDTSTSEWSTICYLKVTHPPTIEILNEKEDGSLQVTESPKFFGKYSNLDVTETEYKYRFVLLDKNLQVVEDSGDQIHIASEEYDSWIFNYLLQDTSQYTLRYFVETKNKYVGYEDYEFLTAFIMIDNTVTFSLEAVNNYDKGSIDIHISTLEPFIGNAVLRRTSSRSDFTIWEDYIYFHSLNEIMDENFSDLFVESGVQYKYGIQKVNANNFRGILVQSNSATSFYEDIFLVGNNQQLSIRFNPKIGSFKRTLMEAKQDTIGGRYPFITRNGDTNYFSFSLNGLISYYMDKNQLFVTSNNLVEQVGIEAQETLNLTDENIVMEREFRVRVESFLTDGNYKFYKSPTEGIMMITLMNVGLSAEETLGRMLYSFAATAYEIGEASLKNCLAKGIIESTGYLDPSEMGKQTVSGQFVGVNMSDSYDLFSGIAQQIASVSNGYSRTLDSLSYIKITTSLPDRRFLINDMPIVISDRMVYELQNIDINSFVSVDNGTTLLIDYIGQAKFVEQAQVGGRMGILEVDAQQYEIVSSLGQLNGVFGDPEGYPSLDVVSAIENKYELERFYNFSYLQILTTDIAVIYINGEKVVINPDTGYIVDTMQVSTLTFESTAFAQINCIYNGYKRKE